LIPTLADDELEIQVHDTGVERLLTIKVFGVVVDVA